MQAAVALAAVELPFTARRAPDSFDHSNTLVARMLRKRNEVDPGPEIDANLTPSYNFYYAKIKFGTPAQEMELLLDTGSPISWVYGPNTTFNGAPQFHPEDSKTFEAYNTSLLASYGSGQYMGYWGADNVEVPAATYDLAKQDSNVAQQFIFGVVDNFAAGAGAPGLLGLGPHYDGAGPDNYTTLPEALYHQNITESPAFSVYLKGDEGKLVLGGWDHNQIEWPVYGFNTIQGRDNFYRVPFTQLVLNHGDDYDVVNTALLDTGSPMSLVPPGFVKKIGEQYNLTLNEKYGTYYTTGNASQLEGWVTFRLGRFEVDVPVQDLFVPGEYIWMGDGPANVTALSLIGSPNYLLGDVFFRHVYTVFDSANKKIYLSRRRQNQTAQNNTIVPFSEDIAYIPGEIQQSNSQSAGNSGAVPSQAAVTSTAPLFANLYEGPTAQIKAENGTGTETSLVATLPSGSALSSGLVVDTSTPEATGAAATSAASASGAKTSDSSTTAASSANNAAVLGYSGILAALAMFL